MNTALIAKQVINSDNPKARTKQLLEGFKLGISKQKAEFLAILTSVKRDTSKVVEFLESSSFFTDPASGRYHNAFKGGLVDHSLNVYYLLEAKVKLFDFDFDHDTLIICALLHDICKTGNYNIKECWRKDANNRWEGYVGYGYNEDPFPAGHGEKSVMMLTEMLSLTREEMLAIRWHSGMVDDPKGYTFINAAKTSNLILLLHTSDFEASILLESQGTVEWLIDI
jgi:hypothetical protein